MKIRNRMSRCPLGRSLFALLYLASAGPWAVRLSAAEENATVEGRLSAAVGYLASDELEGRGIGTKGLDKAAAYLQEQFKSLGLKTELFDGKAFQNFTVTTGARLGKNNQIALVGPPTAEQPNGQRVELKLDTDYSPMAIGGSGRIHLPLVFAGYGITGKAEQYDDYANIDVKGKAVILLRHEPQQTNPHSVFNGTDNSRHAPFTAKLSNAFQHGAAAVIFCTGDVELERRIAAAQRRWQASLDELAQLQAEFKKIEKPTHDQVESQREKVDALVKQIKTYGDQMRDEYDPVLGLRGGGEDNEGRDLPVLFCRRAVLDPIVKAALGKSLGELEKEIDNGPTPHSAELTGWQIDGQADVERDLSTIQNVVAVLEGEGPHADETIVIGAHYDHLGFGGPGAADPGNKEIHNGADDNASGTAVLVEVARQLSQREKKLPRRVVFIAFTGEERGLWGSAFYAKNPLFPLDNTVAMLNMDMVGRLQDNKLIVQGIDTAAEFSQWLDDVNEKLAFQLIKKTGGFGPSDHATFYGKKIPVLHFFTGSHKDYHKATDDADKLAIDGMRRIGEMVTQFAVVVAEAPERPHYQEGKEPIAKGSGGDRPYFGSIPDFSSEQAGYALAGVAKGSPAERGGLKGGDVVIQLGESKIGNLEDIDGALRKHKAGDKVPVIVMRGKEQLKLDVTLDPPK